MLGITPACAGKTVFYPTLTMLARDHPRVCGKNKCSNCYIFHCLGSPPRVREKPCQNDKDADRSRITPACAGKTCTFLPPYFSIWDHPRVCGKNSINAYNVSVMIGSPPRVREKPRFLYKSGRNTRITPACAGKTSMQMYPSTFTQDHPRVCGKNL